MKADLLSYPLPHEKFDFDRLAKCAFKSGMDIIGLVGYTSYEDWNDRTKRPDIRFRWFCEAAFQKDSLEKYCVMPYTWNDSDDTIVAFDVTDRETEKKVTFLWGQDGFVHHDRKQVKVLRLGTRRFLPPDMSLEESMTQARDEEFLFLLDAYTGTRKLPHKVVTLDNFDGVYYDAQHPNPRESETFPVQFERYGMPIVPVGNSHLPWFGRPFGKTLIGLGKGYIEFADFGWDSGYELVRRLMHTIRQRDFSGEMLGVSNFRIAQWATLMLIRKSLRESFRITKYDFVWPENDGDEAVMRLSRLQNRE